MNYQEQLAATRAKRASETRASEFFGVIADGIAPFIVDEKISPELGSQIMMAVIDAILKWRTPK